MVNQFVIDCMAGAFSGMCSVLSGHPLDTLRTKVQVGSGTPTAIAVRLVKAEGVAGLFRGVLPPLLAVGLGIMCMHPCVAYLSMADDSVSQHQPSRFLRTRR